jgi:hypothetical protein
LVKFGGKALKRDRGGKSKAPKAGE